MKKSTSTPIRFNFVGDKTRAQQLTGQARKLLGGVEATKKRRDGGFGHRTVTLADGEKISITSMRGIANITIEAPVVQRKAPPLGFIANPVYEDFEGNLEMLPKVLLTEDGTTYSWDELWRVFEGYGGVFYGLMNCASDHRLVSWGSPGSDDVGAGGDRWVFSEGKKLWQAPNHIFIEEEGEEEGVVIAACLFETGLLAIVTYDRGTIFFVDGEIQEIIDLDGLWAKRQLQVDKNTPTFETVDAGDVDAPPPGYTTDVVWTFNPAAEGDPAYISWRWRADGEVADERYVGFAWNGPNYDIRYRIEPDFPETAEVFYNYEELRTLWGRYNRVVYQVEFDGGPEYGDVGAFKPAYPPGIQEKFGDAYGFVYVGVI